MMIIRAFLTVTNSLFQSMAKEEINAKEFLSYEIKVKSEKELIKRGCTLVQEKTKEIRRKLA